MPHNLFNEMENDMEDFQRETDSIESDINIYEHGQAEEIIVYSRDWTTETIISQINNENIDLSPKFQRRNAWSDEKRSKLIESILLSYPVPEIVLAEDPVKKKSFVVIDGKQRLLTIAGFVNHSKFNYWEKPKLTGLKDRKDLNNIDYQTLQNNPIFQNDLREFNNSTLRCTIITNFSNNDILYDIFYRLNSGAVPLSTQELRQVLNRGPFADYLISATNEMMPLHGVMNLEEPDVRLRDAEVLLRLIVFNLFAKEYKGNLKSFLDEKMGVLNENWIQYSDKVQNLVSNINKAIDKLADILDGIKNVGRKTRDYKFISSFNRVLLEVQVYYFLQLDFSKIKNVDKYEFKIQLYELLDDFYFKNSIESSTKDLNKYNLRYSMFEQLINKCFHLELNLNPFYQY
jgi:uncharacterized FlaG/YvyC family protein